MCDHFLILVILHPFFFSPIGEKSIIQFMITIVYDYDFYLIAIADHSWRNFKQIGMYLITS